MQSATRFRECTVPPETWNSLVLESSDRNIFQTYEWCNSWWDAFGAGFSPQVFTAHDADSIIGLAPFMISRGPLGLRRLEFMANGRADYHGITSRPGYEPVVVQALVDKIAASRDLWDIALLDNLPSDSRMTALLRDGLSAAGLYCLELKPVACPTVVLRGCETAVLERQDRYSIRRKIRSLQRLGPVVYEVVTGHEAVSSLLPILFDQHRRRWKAAGQKSQFEDPLNETFFRSLALALDRKGWLHFSRLYCGDQVVACHFGFQYCGRLYWYKPSFDPGYARHSPGLVLLHHLVQDAVGKGFDEFDFTVGAEAFKLRFANDIRTNARLRVFHSRGLRSAALAYDTARQQAGRWWRQARRAPEPGEAGTGP